MRPVAGPGPDPKLFDQYDLLPDRVKGQYSGNLFAVHNFPVQNVAPASAIEFMGHLVEVNVKKAAIEGFPAVKTDADRLACFFVFTHRDSV
jgi:hypothetical protein|tara:strand:+ start:2430 stop:2702 length:273 start_codon:yes stop_codon:yes gene_type:complete